jgi:hypothetical protein
LDKEDKMKQEEKQYLIQEKVKLGISKFDACVEVRADELTQNGFSKLKRELEKYKKTIIQMQNRIDSLNLKLKEKPSKQEILVKSLKSHDSTYEGHHNQFANTVILKRAIHSIQERKSAYSINQAGELAEEIGCHKSQAKDCIQFISKFCDIKC